MGEKKERKNTTSDEPLLLQQMLSFLGQRHGGYDLDSANKDERFQCWNRLAHVNTALINK